MAGLKKGTVELKEHNEKWKKEYKREVSRLNSIIGEKVCGFEHIGSTAIQGIKAKPVIDMIAVIKESEELEKIVSLLEENGYEHRPKGDRKGRKFLAKGPKENRTHYLSLTREGSELYKRTTNFRDYLNSHPQAAKKYSQLKQKLAEKYPEKRKKYTEEKTEFIENILDKGSQE